MDKGGVGVPSLTAAVFMSSFIARRAASWQMDAISAPEQPSVCKQDLSALA